MGLEESSMKKATIQMNLFDYFYEQDNFTIKEVRGKRVNDESIRARIYEEATELVKEVRVNYIKFK